MNYRPSIDPVLAFAAAGFLVTAIGVLWWWFPVRQANRLRLKIRDPKARADVEDNIRKTLGQFFGGIAVLAGAGFAYYQSQLTLRASYDLLISQQAAKGFEQLGNEKIAIRLGGIYALEAVLNGSPEYHRSVVEAFCAVVRQAPAGGHIEADVQAILMVLGRRIVNRDETRLDLSGSHLAGASLASGEFRSALFAGADLSRADLSNAHFESADLTGAHLDLANMEGIHLSNAVLEGAHLKGANLDRAELDVADFMEGADLEKAPQDAGFRQPGLHVDPRGSNAPRSPC